MKKKKKTETKIKNIIGTGKRKTAIAKAFIKEGSGKITINKKSAPAQTRFCF